MLCRLVHISSATQTIYPLKDGIITIGRDTDNDIQLPSEYVSRHHIRISNFPDSCIIEDMGSTNGKLQTSCRLKDGDKIQIGRDIFLFEETRYDETDSMLADRQYSSDVQVPTVRMKWRHEPGKKISVHHKETNKKTVLKRK